MFLAFLSNPDTFSICTLSVFGLVALVITTYAIYSGIKQAKVQKQEAAAEQKILNARVTQIASLLPQLDGMGFMQDDNGDYFDPGTVYAVEPRCAGGTLLVRARSSCFFLSSPERIKEFLDRMAKVRTVLPMPKAPELRQRD